MAYKSRKNVTKDDRDRKTGCHDASLVILGGVGNGGARICGISERPIICAVADFAGDGWRRMRLPFSRVVNIKMGQTTFLEIERGKSPSTGLSGHVLDQVPG